MASKSVKGAPSGAKYKGNTVTASSANKGAGGFDVPGPSEDKRLNVDTYQPGGQTFRGGMSPGNEKIGTSVGKITTSAHFGRPAHGYKGGDSPGVTAHDGKASAAGSEPRLGFEPSEMHSYMGHFSRKPVLEEGHNDVVVAPGLRTPRRKPTLESPGFATPGVTPVRESPAFSTPARPTLEKPGFRTPANPRARRSAGRSFRRMG